MWKARTQVIQSLQFLVSHQIIRPYSSVRRTHGLNYTCFTGTRVLGKFWGNWAQIPQIMCRDTWKVIQSLQLLVSHQMRPYSSVRTLCGSSYITSFTCTRVLGQFGETGPKYPKSCAERDTWKVIQSLQLLVLHQMRPYTSVRTLFGLSYTFFTGTQVLGQFGETLPEYPKSCTGTHEK